MEQGSFFDADDWTLHDAGEFPPIYVEAPSLVPHPVEGISASQRDSINDILNLTGHELGDNLDWDNEDHLQRLLTMGLLPEPRSSIGRFIIERTERG